MNVRRRGFTLIEILIVIGIILVLVGIVFTGITYVGRASRVSSTKVTLGNLRGMIAELEAKTKLNTRQPPHQWVHGTPNATQETDTLKINLWAEGDPTNTAAPEPDPLLVPDGSVESGNAKRVEYAAVRNTQLAMMLLAAMPANKTMIQNLPAQSLMKLPEIKNPDTTLNEATLPGVPLDPWGNPIILVPSAGLCGDPNPGPAVEGSMWVGGPSSDSDGIRFVVAVPQAGNTARIGPIRSSDGRPFWASAGPDGDFRSADDNIYSFEN
ncbi:MAG: prepilin-type N-terminal cleavage/methylation domain-containing protein [Planctomycetota bacterium]|nr:prepilin-type N-terminal cleavage/methylation domain-containing protein [Planctomycetota bacterium]